MFETETKIYTSAANQTVEDLYNRYGKKLFGYSVSKWNVSEDEAWELVYKTLYKIARVKDSYTFENENRFSAFLFSIFINFLRNHYRDVKKKQPETLELKEKNIPSSQVQATEPEGKEVVSPEMDCLQKELKKLEDWQRILLLMRAQDFSYEEIGKYVEKPIDQLKVYHMRIKKNVTGGTKACMEHKK